MVKATRPPAKPAKSAKAIKRGDVYWVNLDPTVGSEIRKTRPALVISPDDMNHALPRVIVALPAAVTRAAHLRADQRVRVSVEGDQVVITPMTDPHLSLEQRLAAYDPARHGGEVFRSV